MSRVHSCESPSELLLDNGVADAVRAQALFPNQGLHTAAKAFAIGHRRAIQYLEQAPVLVLGAMAGGPAVRRINGLYIQHKLVPLCERGAALKDVMRAFGLAPPLRKLTPYALFPGAGPIVAALSQLDPAVLGRVIPTRPGAQRNWLMACRGWRERMARRQGQPDLHFAWAAEAMALAGVRPQAAGDVADFAATTGNTVNPAWKWPRAVEETNRWHGTLTADRVIQGTPFKRTTVIDLGLQADDAIHDGYAFHALRTPQDLAEEGTAMRHCVATYVSSVANGRSHIVSIRRNGARVATLELDRSWLRVQCKGKANSQPSGDVLTAADHYAFAVRQHLAERPAR